MRVKKTYWILVEFTGDEKIQLGPGLNENITDCKWVSFDKLVLVLEENHERICYLIEFFIHMPFYNDYRIKLKKY
jgi:hypothetical protein|tara:strand:- start:4037 stop:4261 length:225 start_codon:yes stop_codon:yes gene_type:complete